MVAVLGGVYQILESLTHEGYSDCPLVTVRAADARTAAGPRPESAAGTKSSNHPPAARDARRLFSHRLNGGALLGLPEMRKAGPRTAVI